MILDNWEAYHVSNKDREIMEGPQEGTPARSESTGDKVEIMEYDDPDRVTIERVLAGRASLSTDEEVEVIDPAAVADSELSDHKYHV